MGIFAGQIFLHNKPDGKENEWQLDHAFAYFTNNGDKITVLPGASTDGASIPRLFWRIIGPPLRDPRVTAAALIHDQLYKTVGALGRYSKKEVDGIFYEALMSAGVSRFKATIMYWSVRIGGSWEDKSFIDARGEMKYLSVTPAKTR